MMRTVGCSASSISKVLVDAIRTLALSWVQERRERAREFCSAAQGLHGDRR
jgi:hypothetical protein